MQQSPGVHHICINRKSLGAKPSSAGAETRRWVRGLIPRIDRSVPNSPKCQSSKVPPALLPEGLFAQYSFSPHVLRTILYALFVTMYFLSPLALAFGPIVMTIRLITCASPRSCLCSSSYHVIHHSTEASRPTYFTVLRFISWRISFTILSGSAGSTEPLVGPNCGRSQSYKHLEE